MIDAFLDCVPSTTFTFRFYANPRDTGEGATLIGSLQNVTTEANGFSSINDFTPTKSVPVGHSITATATDAAGNTSEFTGGAPFGQSGSLVHENAGTD